MLRYMLAVVDDDERYMRVTLVLGAMMLLALVVLVAATLPV